MVMPRGFKHSEAAKRRMSITHKEYFKVHKHWLKGTRHSEEHKNRIKISMKKYVKKHRPDFGKFNKGKKYSLAHRINMSIAQTGEKGSGWKGGRCIDSRGYILIYQPNHPFPNADSYVFEHRLVMEKALERYLKPEEVVHHKGERYPINSIENRQDNRKKNLKLFINNSAHQKFHIKLRHQ